MKTLTTWEFDSPIGEIVLVSAGTNMCAIDYKDCAVRMHRLMSKRFGAFRLARSFEEPTEVFRLKEYFAGDLGALETLPVDIEGTAFQNAVWQALLLIPVGTTQTYGWLAREIGRPQAVRAVGAATSRNPIALIVPCHRLVGANGKLTGYAGGLRRKEWLLAHERGVGVKSAQRCENKDKTNRDLHLLK